MTQHSPVGMLSPHKGTLIGIVAGIVVWLILFLPITALLVQPASNGIVILSAVESKHAVFSEDINQSIRNIALSAIVFHLLWGAIFGFITSSLVRTSSFQDSIWRRILRTKGYYQIDSSKKPYNTPNQRWTISLLKQI
jgi:ABC-type sulfate transport system permease component